MLCQRVIFALSVLTFPASALAQSDVAINATAEQIAGYWQLLPLPDKLEPKFFPSNPWPAECQWFAYSNNAELKTFDKLRGPCDQQPKAQLEKIFNAIPAVISWQYDMSPVYYKGVLIIKRSDVKGYSELWEPQIVVQPFTRDGVEFRKGDLLLYLVNLKEKKIVWIRHLRKID